LKKKKSVTTYVDGKKNGQFKNWYKNQMLKSEGYYKNNLMHDDWKFYYKSGNIMVQGVFINGNGKNKNKITQIPLNGRDGIWIGWHENGKKWSQLSFKGGKRSGLQENWYDNGQKELQGKYDEGEPIDKWSWWYYDGAQMQEGMYRDDGTFEGLYFINPPVPEFTSP